MHPDKTGFIQNRKESVNTGRILNMQVYRWQATLCVYHLRLKELLGWEFAEYQKPLKCLKNKVLYSNKMKQTIKIKTGPHLYRYSFWNSRENKIEKPNWKSSELCWIDETSKFCLPCPSGRTRHQETWKRDITQQPSLANHVQDQNTVHQRLR